MGNKRHENLTWRSLMHRAVNVELSQESISHDMLVLAKQCDNVDDFESKCEAQETWVKSADAGRMRLSSLPRCWTQTKSNIKAAMKRGIDVKGYDTESSLRKAKVEANKPAPRQQQATQRQEREPQPAPKPVEATQSVSGGVPEDLVSLVKYLEPLSELSRVRAVKKLTKDAKRFHDDHCQSMQKGKESKGPSLQDKWRKARSA